MVLWAASHFVRYVDVLGVYSEFEVNIYGYKSEINLLAIHASGVIMTIFICKSFIQKPFQQAYNVQNVLMLHLRITVIKLNT